MVDFCSFCAANIGFFDEISKKIKRYLPFLFDLSKKTLSLHRILEIQLNSLILERW